VEARRSRGPQAAAAVVRERAPGFAPRVGVVLGSGLGAVADALEDRIEVPYGDLPGFKVSTVGGHAGRLVLGRRGGTPVALLSGRAHVYEGSTPEQVAAGVRTLRALGAEAVVLTCAAGSLDPANGPGSLVVFSDHINLMGFNPLAGPNDDALGPRFPSLSGLYDAELRARLHAAAGEPLPEGVYLAVAGPSFETPAEIRAFRTLGADLVGMSTVPEAIAARHCGLRVAAVAAVTNLAEGMGDVELSHEQTLAEAARGGERLAAILGRFLEEF
jgi:xanthosine phosphorylase